jgi:hypothetical protein
VLRERVLDRFAAGLRAALLRAAPAPDDFAREEDAFFAVRLFVVDAFAVERLAPDALPPLDFLAPLLREDEDAVLVLALPSIVHLPDITRWAASATASAISEPSLVALAIMLVAAWDAVSAASRPASRIARRAFGLALIAAAAAARPAASISLLIAALASLSTVALPELEDDPDDLEDVFREDLAIASISLRCGKDTSSP